MDKAKFFKEYKGVLQQNIAIIENIIEETDNFYGNIGERLPLIENEINDTMEETELLIKHFINVSSKEETDDTNIMINIFNDLHKNIKIINESIKTDEDVKNILSSFISTKENKENLFVIISNLSNKLRKVLNSLHVLSINASIYSYKQGNQGSGINVISKKIGNLSQSTKKEYNQLIEYIDDLSDWHKAFRSELERLYKKEDEVNEKIIKVDREFINMVRSLNVIANLLNQIMDNIKETLEPFYDILVMIQNQDIIRQNLENIIKIFKKTYSQIEEFDNNQSIEVRLNSIVFMNNAASISSKLMENLIKELDKYLFTVNENIHDIEKKLVEIEEDQGHLTDFIVGKYIDKNKDLASINYIYDEVEKMVPLINDDIKTILERQKLITGRKEKFITLLKQVESKFSDISNNAEILNKIQFLSKIEFSRIDRNTHFVENISKSIKHFINVSQNQNDVFIDLKSTLTGQWDKFTDIMERNTEKLTDNITAIKQIEEKILFTRKLITETIHNLNRSFGKLVKEIKQTKDDMQQCGKIAEQGEKVIVSLKGIIKKSKNMKDIYLEENNYDEWQINNTNLQDILSLFTSYIERDIAQKEFADHEIDTGSQGGELTLF
ncbi:MAG: hypothetical protein ACOC4G_10015 [Bacillota bacterium]